MRMKKNHNIELNNQDYRKFMKSDIEFVVFVLVIANGNKQSSNTYAMMPRI